MKKHFLFLLFSFVFLLSANLFAQDVDLGKGFRKDKKGMDAFFKAEEYFDQGYFLLALPFYRSLEPQYGSSDYLIYRIGICLLYKSDEVDVALEYLLRVQAKNPKAADIDLFVARGYHMNGRYDEAIQMIDLYEKKKNLPPGRIKEAEQLRQYCQNAKALVAHPVEAKITNIGAPVNTENSEYVPVVSSDDSVMLFTYRGERSTGGLQSYPGIPDSSGYYFEDVFYTWRSNGKWQEPVPLDSTLNGNGHDACIGISNDGQTLLIYKDEAGNGDIFTSKLEGFYWIGLYQLKGNVNSQYWEGSATFTPDMKTLFFASDRPGGYGGRDIYVATLQADSTWGDVKNLGPNVNTPMDEDAPFIHPNGTTLIFSSQSHNSMGGYDVFRAELTQLDSATWSTGPAENLGYPINTPGDDKYFVLGTDGKHGYYSSGKPGGFGQQDIYLVESDFGLKKSVVLQVNGIVTLNDKPVESKITIKDTTGKFRPYDIYSNETNGKYLANLPTGKKYSLSFTIDGQPAKVFTVASPDTLTEMITKEINVKFYSGNYKEVLRRNDSIRVADSLAGMTRRVTKLDTSIYASAPRGISADDFESILSQYGNAKAPGLMFHVQIAAYNLPQNYNSSHLQSLGSIDKRKLDDGITRFTMGTFETLAEAEAFRKMIIAAGQTDAFVTAEKDGKRYLLQQLAILHFFQN
jgi:hypothetical protein